MKCIATQTDLMLHKLQFEIVPFDVPTTDVFPDFKEVESFLEDGSYIPYEVLNCLNKGDMVFPDFCCFIEKNPACKELLNKMDADGYMFVYKSKHYTFDYDTKLPSVVFCFELQRSHI